MVCYLRLALSFCVFLFLIGCGIQTTPITQDRAYLTPETQTAKDLRQLPIPRGKIFVAVYDFLDKSGQYKRSPASSYSTAAPQGGAALLMKALWESNWFVPLERQGLNNLLTERKIILSQNKDALPHLTPASILVEGGIVAYDANVYTGGLGANYLGVGASGRYQSDQITVNVRAVDIRSGRVLCTVNVSKTLLSTEIRAGVFRYLDYKKILSTETGITHNEPAQLCLTGAIETGVIYLIIQGIANGVWQLKDNQDLQHPVLQKYFIHNQLTPELS